jgi:hypothetical protein
VNTIPQELNWVEKRAACSAGQVLNELRRGIDNDVAIINAIRNLPQDQRFTAEMLTDRSTLVVGQLGNTPRPRVKIGLADSNTIAYHSDISTSQASATVGLNNEGRCILKLKLEDGTDGAELEQWQFRKMALESLFFGVQQ